MRKFLHHCLQIATRPVDFTGGIGSFIVGYAASFQVFGRLIRNGAYVKTSLSFYTLLLAAFLFGSFFSMILWRYSSKMLSSFFGETDEPALSSTSRQVTKFLGIGFLITLFAFYLQTLF